MCAHQLVSQIANAEHQKVDNSKTGVYKQAHRTLASVLFLFHNTKRELFIHNAMSLPVTPKQKEVLDFIVQFINEQGYPPSYREIADGLTLASPSTVHVHVQSLRERGYLRNSAGSARELEPTDKAMRWGKSAVLPLMGLITAGEPIEAVQENETFAVPVELAPDSANSYVLRVKGESMIEDGILDGDYVVIERNPSPKNGDVVVALLDNSYATLKRFYREKDRIRLQPANSKMKPIYCHDPLIQGVVRAVIRNFRKPVARYS